MASTTSSTSDHFFSSGDPYTSSTTGTGGATIIPTSARRHRSSSNLSTRSSRSIRDSLHNNATNTSVSGVAAPRDQSVQASSRPSMELSRPDMSRQNSMSASGFRSSSSMTSSPHMVSSQTAYGYPHRTSVSSNAPNNLSTSSATAVESAPMSAYPRSPSSSATAAAAMRYEEAALQRVELEAVKRENEILRARVKELEKSLQKANEVTEPAGSTPTS